METDEERRQRGANWGQSKVGYEGPAPNVFAGGALGGGFGAVLGFLLGGPIGAAIFGGLGAAIGGGLVAQSEEAS